MRNRALTVHADDQVRDALLQLQEGGVGLALVVGDGGVVGTVSDGDIRRAALRGADLGGPVRELVHDEPVVVAPDTPDGDVRALLDRLGLPGALVVDGDTVVGVRTHAEVGGSRPEASAMILAGGRGQRLRPLTDKVPKPLLTVGRTTIVERLLEALCAAGVRDVSLAVNYKAELFEQKLGDGDGYGLRLRYLRERKPLHTAGPLTLLPEPPGGPLIIMNADQVTALHFARLVDFHRQEGAAITVAAFEHEVTIPYGVLRLDGVRLLQVDEKPTMRFQCNAGIYVVEPDVIPLVPRNTYFGMPELVEAAMAEGREVAVFPIIEKFIDIGTREELERALLWFTTGEEV